MRVFSKGSDSGRCPTLCCLYRVLAITLSWTVRKNGSISDDRGLNTGRQQGHTFTVPQPRDTTTHGGNILNPSLLEKGLSHNLSIYLFLFLPKPTSQNGAFSGNRQGSECDTLQMELTGRCGGARCVLGKRRRMQGSTELCTPRL